VFGRKGLADSTTPLCDPDRGVESIVARGGKINIAMQAALCLFTDALRNAGRDPGELALPGPVRPNVGTLVANCVTYEGSRGLEYATLALTGDFEDFAYLPHCFLFLIGDAVGTAETLPDPRMRAQLVAEQCPEPLFHAHAMRQWLRHVRPVENALAGGDEQAMQRAMADFAGDLALLRDSAPGWMQDEVDLEELVEDWCSGYPVVIGAPLKPTVRRINGIPMARPVAELVEDFLAEFRMGSYASRAAYG
jgi:hypothetical protein